MALLKIRVKKLVVIAELETLGVDPKNKEWEWVDKAIRTENIESFDSYGSKKVIIYFYTEQAQPPIIVSEPFDVFFERLQGTDYQIPTNEGKEDMS